MGMKRTITLEASDAAALVKRVKRVERRSALNKPEMKTKTIELNAWPSAGGTAIPVNTVNLLQPCQIAEGTGSTDRIGDKIRVWRIEVRGLADIGLDHYIIQNHTTSNPGISSFGGEAGAYLLDSENNKRFTEWVHYRNYYTGTASTDIVNVKFSQKWKNGIIVKYNGSASTSAVDNVVNYVILNRTGGSRSASVSLRMWYTDA